MFKPLANRLYFLIPKLQVARAPRTLKRAYFLQNKALLVLCSKFNNIFFLPEKNQCFH